MRPLIDSKRMIRNMSGLVGLVLAGLSAGAQAQDAPSCSPDAVPLDDKTASYIDGLIDARKHVYHAAGVTVAIVKDGRLVFARGYGTADADTGRPVDPFRTPFRVGSITKLFTHTSAMQLYEQGRLDLDADVNSYLDGAPIKEAFGEPVTANDIMGHRPGFESPGFGFDFFAHPERAPTLREFVSDYQAKRVRAPGEATAYSNFGLSTLGLVVEDISGVPYDRYVSENILAPLGMTHTSLREPVDDPAKAPYGRMDEALAAEASKGHAWGPGGYKTLPVDHIFPSAAPAGSMYASAGDMACFMLAYLNDGAYNGAQILKPETVAFARTRAFTDRAGTTDFAHGWFNYSVNGHEIYQHTGAMMAFTANLVLAPDLNIGVFMAANSTSGWPLTADTPMMILEHLEPSLRPEPSSPAADAQPPLEAFAGRYLTTVRSYAHLDGLLEIGSGEGNVSVAGDKLLIATGGVAGLWHRVAPLVFEDAEGARKVRFMLGDNGEVVSYYPSYGHAAYERIPYWRASVFLKQAMAASAFAGLLVLFAAAAGGLARPEDGTMLRWTRRLSIATAALAIALVWLAQRAADALGGAGWRLMFSWPVPALQHYVWAGYALALFTAALAAAMLFVWRGRWPVWSKALETVFVVSLAVTLFCLASWNLFAPAQH